jgi:hypothetical protein
MTEKEHENIFKFSIYQGKNALSERIFSADTFNPVIRYSVDIRPIISEIIQRLQVTLSRRNLNFNKIDEEAHVPYDFIKEYKNVCESFNLKPVKLKKPYYHVKEINGKTIKGTECKFGLYMNNNPIVERDFYVDQYNPAVRFSYEIIEVTRDIVKDIVDFLKQTDTNHMWDDYGLIHTYGIYINQIRELSNRKREELLKNMDNYDYVKKVKKYYRSLSSQQQIEAEIK